jgi:hypothetical protein
MASKVFWGKSRNFLNNCSSVILAKYRWTMITKLVDTLKDLKYSRT